VVPVLVIAAGNKPRKRRQEAFCGGGAYRQWQVSPLFLFLWEKLLLEGGGGEILKDKGRPSSVMACNLFPGIRHRDVPDSTLLRAY